ncbi:hypothetical protein Bca52824_011231 [Brassica carinata]|uniref:Zinc knuckle CX2CX4HX4C domain-containing protein n=1 Tax=Brassica carinata TaxID=52824 RepID=A0A8X7WCV1_BRACI|nr:hypothetical protein Bca52824_011231 [Brassica carinata]
MEKDLWMDFQNLDLGSDQTPKILSSEAKKKGEDNHRFSSVVKALNPHHQNPAGIKLLMPNRINEDETVQFFFRHEHQLLTVLEHGPWNYRDWMVITDRWTRRHQPDYLKTITLWVQIHNIPDESREEGAIREIGDVLGHIEEVFIQQPTREQQGEVWIRVIMDAYGRLIFTRYIYFDEHEEPILIRFTYEKLRRFCTHCGSLQHDVDICDYNPLKIQPGPYDQEEEEVQAPNAEPNMEENQQAHHSLTNKNIMYLVAIQWVASIQTLTYRWSILEMSYSQALLATTAIFFHSVILHQSSISL